MKELIRELIASATLVIVLALIVSGLYPATVWILSQGFFHREAGGSLVMKGSRVLGSDLIAQRFAGPAYFHPRPSAAGKGYDAVASGGSNLGPISGQLVSEVAARVARYRKDNGLSPNVPIPAEAVTASASGLDPHISPMDALLQAPRVAKARGLGLEKVHAAIRACTEGRDLAIFGEPRVNVLKLNLALDSTS